jgi:hypothetical protein
MPWFHGGVPGLKVGDYIEPPTKTGFDTIRRYGEAGTVECARVFITRDPRYAASYAATYGRGDVYEVEPEGQRGEDETYFIAGLSQWCERARVVRVTRRGVVRRRDGTLTR